MNYISIAAATPTNVTSGEIHSRKGSGESAFATNPVIDTILSRSAAKYYDAAATLSDDQIRELVRIGTTAPTSFHLQNWRFIAVREVNAKARLREAAYGQAKVGEAAVTFIVCGTLAGRVDLGERLRPSVEAGLMPDGIIQN